MWRDASSLDHSASNGIIGVETDEIRSWGPKSWTLWLQLLVFEPSGRKSHAPDSILEVPKANSKILAASRPGGNREAKPILFLVVVNFSWVMSEWVGGPGTGEAGFADRHPASLAQGPVDR